MDRKLATLWGGGYAGWCGGLEGAGAAKGWGRGSTPFFSLKAPAGAPQPEFFAVGLVHLLASAGSATGVQSRKWGKGLGNSRSLALTRPVSSAKSHNLSTPQCPYM